MEKYIFIYGCPVINGTSCLIPAALMCAIFLSELICMVAVQNKNSEAQASVSNANKNYSVSSIICEAIQSLVYCTIVCFAFYFALKN